jgi:hypothetical protein
MDCSLEAPKETLVGTNSTFDNIKGIDMFKVNEKTIKQMKRLQNPKIMNDESIDMEDIEHQCEDEDMTTIENNFTKKEKKKGLKRC